MYPQRNAFEMAAHEVQFKKPESIKSIMTEINNDVDDLKKLLEPSFNEIWNIWNQKK